MNWIAGRQLPPILALAIAVRDRLKKSVHSYSFFVVKVSSLLVQWSGVESGDQMNNSSENRNGLDWRSLYLYAVCLITLIVSLFAIVGAIRSVTGLIYPDPGYLDPNMSKASSDLAHKAQLLQSRHNSILGIVDGFTTLIVTVPVYLYHWKLIGRNSSSSTT